MTTNDVVVTGQLLPPVRDRRKLISMARALDNEIRREIALVQTSLSRLAQLLSQMHDSDLWKYVHAKGQDACFSRFEHYVESVVGPMGRTKVYDLLAIGRLGGGSNPVPSETIQKLGRIKAAELARLDPTERTPELLQEAVEQSVPAVRQRVQEIINKSLPPEQRREVHVFFSRSYPPQVIDKFEQLEARGCFIEGIRDGDRTLTLRAKFMLALIFCFESTYATELAEADRYIEAMRSNKMQDTLAHDDEEAYGPPEPEEFEAAIDQIGE